MWLSCIRCWPWSEARSVVSWDAGARWLLNRAKSTRKRCLSHPSSSNPAGAKPQSEGARNKKTMSAGRGPRSWSSCFVALRGNMAVDIPLDLLPDPFAYLASQGAAIEITLREMNAAVTTGQTGLVRGLRERGPGERDAVRRGRWLDEQAMSWPGIGCS